MSPEEQKRKQAQYSFPMMTPDTKRYRVGGERMRDQRNFEDMERIREQQRQPRRLKGGGPVQGMGARPPVPMAPGRLSPKGTVERPTAARPPPSRPISDPTQGNPPPPTKPIRDPTQGNPPPGDDVITTPGMPGSFMKKGGKVSKYAKGGSVNWIKDAIKKPGALRAQLGAKEGKPIPKGKLKAAAAKPGKLGQRARLAQTLGKMKKG
jgi:hypothetical protein